MNRTSVTIGLVVLTCPLVLGAALGGAGLDAAWPTRRSSGRSSRSSSTGSCSGWTGAAGRARGSRCCRSWASASMLFSYTIVNLYFSRDAQLPMRSATRTAESAPRSLLGWNFRRASRSRARAHRVLRRTRSARRSSASAGCGLDDRGRDRRRPATAARSTASRRAQGTDQAADPAHLGVARARLRGGLAVRASTARARRRRATSSASRRASTRWRSGESEVLGQVRTALRLARETGSTRAVLHRLFESAARRGQARPRGDRDRAAPAVGRRRSASSSRRRSSATWRSRPSSSSAPARPGTPLRAARGGGRACATSASPTARPSARAALAAQDRRIVACAGSACPGRAPGRGRRRRERPRARRPSCARDDVERAMRAAAGQADVLPGPRRAAGTSTRPSSEVYNVYAYGLDDLEGVGGGEPAAPRAGDAPGRGDPGGGARALPRLVRQPGGRPDRERPAEAARRVCATPSSSRASAAEERERCRAFADAIAAKLLHEPMRRLKSETDASRRSSTASRRSATSSTWTG